MKVLGLKKNLQNYFTRRKSPFLGIFLLYVRIHLPQNSYFSFLSLTLSRNITLFCTCWSDSWEKGRSHTWR